MVRIRLWAIGIGEVREIFGAPSEVAAARLAELTPPAVTSPRAPGLLGKLGPLLRRASDAPVIPADQPTRADAEALLKGSFIVPNRLPAAWALVTRWVGEQAWGALEVRLDRDRVDFDLARAGSRRTTASAICGTGTPRCRYGPGHARRWVTCATRTRSNWQRPGPKAWPNWTRGRAVETSRLSSTGWTRCPAGPTRRLPGSGRCRTCLPWPGRGDMAVSGLVREG